MKHKTKNNRHKRISRRELKETLKAERQLYIASIKDQQLKYDELESKYDELKKRFDMLGQEAHEIIGFPNGGIEKVAVEAKAYGSYMYVSDWEPEVIDYAMQEIARQFAEGLVKNSLIKFSIHAPDNHDLLQGSFGTVGGTLYVVPWEQVNRTGRHMVIQKFQNLPENGGELYDPDHSRMDAPGKPAGDLWPCRHDGPGQGY